MKAESCRVKPARAGRADRVVQDLTGLSRAGVRGLFDHDCVTVNSRPARDPGERLAAGDTVEVRWDPGTRYHQKPRPRLDRAFRVLHEDEHLVVVDKAAFVLTVPTDRREENTLVQRVSEYLARGGRARRVQVVQRLDRGTSGILVLARTREAALDLRRQFSRHEPDREYIAFVAGVVASDGGTFDSRLATNRSLSRYSTRDAEGEHAVTRFVVETRGRDFTRVRVRLDTGRRNQIRVHFAEAGHPVIGDPRYAPERARHRRWRHRRLALHAAVLGFRHPATGKTLRFESPLPAEFGVFGGRGRRDTPAAGSRRRHTP